MSGLESIKASAQAAKQGIEAVMSALGMQAPDMMALVSAFAYAAGIFFVAISFSMMTKAANPTAQQSLGGGGHSLGWWWSLSIGVMLFALPETMSAIGGTFFAGIADTSPFLYSTQLGGNLGAGSCPLSGVRPLLMVFGYIAVIRGLIVFRAVGIHGNHSHGNASVGRGVVLCIAGILLVHMQQTLQIINSATNLTLGANLC